MTQIRQRKTTTVTGSKHDGFFLLSTYLFALNCCYHVFDVYIYVAELYTKRKRISYSITNCTTAKAAVSASNCKNVNYSIIVGCELVVMVGFANDGWRNVRRRGAQQRIESTIAR